jgi:hypothetical protein
MKSFNRTNERTIGVAAIHTWFCDDIGHSDAFSLMKSDGI